jgi:hypothetical protein
MCGCNLFGGFRAGYECGVIWLGGFAKLKMVGYIGE